MNVVTMDAVTKRYRDALALDGVSMALAENTIHGLLGRNGAGKTTAMQVLAGQVLPTSGTVEVFGARPYENADVLRRVCLAREGQRYPDTFSVGHALRAASLVFPRWDAAFADELVADFGLPLRRRIKRLSRGMLSAVGVVIGLASRAELTFFDEPYLGLNAVARQLFYDRLLADFAERPRTVVLSTHLIDEVADLIEHVVLLDKGRVLIDADAEALRSRAVTVTGPVREVESFVAGHNELHREGMGGYLRVTVTGPLALTSPGPASPGLALEPVSLQQLVVHTTVGAGNR